MKKKTLVVLSALLLSFHTKAQTIDEGIKAWENDKLNKAASIFRTLAKGNNPEANYYLGNIYLEFERPDSAKMAFNDGITKNPSNPYCYVGLGKIALNDKNGTESKKNFDKALSITKEKDAKVLNAIGSAYSTADIKEPKKAIEYYNKSLALDKRNPDTFLGLGDAYLDDLQGGPAITNYEKALEINNKLPKPYLRIGQVYVRSRNWSTAEENLKKAIELDPGYSIAYKDLGELYYKQRKYDKAAEALKTYIDLADRNVSSLTKYAYALFLNKDYDNASKTINEVIKLDSSNYVMKRLLGYSYYETKKYPEGLSYMNKFFAQVKPEKIIASDYTYYGRLYNKTNNDSLAALNFEKSLAIDTGDVEVLGELADVYTHWKKYPQAQTAYTKKIKSLKNPSALDYFGLGKAYYYDKKYTEADTAFASVIAIKPDVTIGYLWRCRSKIKIGDVNYELCKPYADKFISLAYGPDGKLNPKVQTKEIIEILQYEASYFAAKEDMVKVKEYLNKILETDPNNKEAKDMLSKLK
jgi:tetratricopeptide (TPR) repeat protein